MPAAFDTLPHSVFCSWGQSRKWIQKSVKPKERVRRRKAGNAFLSSRSCVHFHDMGMMETKEGVQVEVQKKAEEEEQRWKALCSYVDVFRSPNHFHI